MNEHICTSCKRVDCPEHGKETYDGMLGPTIDCLTYTPLSKKQRIAILIILAIGIFGICGLICGLIY